MGFEKFLERLSDRSGLRNEMNLVHVRSDQIIFKVVGDRLQEIASPHQPDYVFEAFLKNRDAGKRDVGVGGDDFTNRGGAFERSHDGAWGHDLRNPHLIQRERVGDDARFALGEGSFHRSALGEEHDFLVGVRFFGRGGDHDPNQQITEVGDRSQRVAHPEQRIDHVGLQGLAVNDAEVFGNDLGEEKDAERHARGDDTEPSLAPQLDSLGADRDRAQGIGDGVEGEDRGDRFLETGLELFENNTAARAGFLQRLNF